MTIAIENSCFILGFILLNWLKKGGEKEGEIRGE